MLTVCELNKCAGCMACLDICLCEAITIKDDIEAYNAVIDQDKCVECNACHKICQANTQALKKAPQIWKQGWIQNDIDRSQSASGGFASGIARSFVRSGGKVCGCVFEHGEFIFNVIDNEHELKRLSGSKYVKSNPVGIYNKIKRLLVEGNKVLFIGLPCQVASLTNYINVNLKENLYTIDLICHGSPSPRLLETYLKQYQYSLSEIGQIRFRKKEHFQLSQADKGEDTYRPIGSKGVLDSYMIGFLNCLFYTQNCYDCQYASIDRVSDITLGDSWGSNLSEYEQKKGISLAFCQTDKGQVLLNMAQLYLTDVDKGIAIAHNHQLREPASTPQGRSSFFDGINKGKSFNALVWKCYPVKCIKQEIKKILIHLRLFGWGTS